ncbi:MAG: beta-ketoacyl-[acyl-carrier-protein] synthase family protein [Deltaproteobacteria bacterium]|nr:beta-ketoacyl-[acyl-carrier-protein] synthase family protein [Deltaproteobacteria bacterium]
MARINNPSDIGYPVAITGIGMVTPLGITTKSCWENLLLGKSGITRITKFDSKNCLTQIGGQLPESYSEWEKIHIPKRMTKQTIKTTRVFRLCAADAIQDSGFKVDSLNPKRCAVVVGTSGASVRSPEDQEAGADKFRIIREMFNAIPARVSLDYGFQGPSFTVSSSSESGACAVARAYDAIRWGKADLVVTGGVDAFLTQNNIERFGKFNLLTVDNAFPEKAIKPFDLHRSGFVLSDGGCALILESVSHALRRNARVYAWITGYGSFTDSGQTALSHEKMAKTLLMALRNSGLRSDQIGHICANGTATIQNDRSETRAIKSVFGDLAPQLLISASKSMLGHMMGASGVTDIAIAALSLHTKKIPPTINYSDPDPECDLNYVPNKMIEVSSLKAAVTQDFGIGGHHCAMVLEKTPWNQKME